MKTTQKVKWIDVRKSLPEKDQSVICIQNPNTTATRKPLLSVFDGEKFCVPYVDIYSALVASTGQRWVDIIYWMPFPKTPKELQEIDINLFASGEIEPKKI